MPGMCFAYYCSGHGYGHATRVSAFACHLLTAINPRPTIYIVSSAPQHIFAGSTAQGACYRYAEIDPVVVQPLAYRIDRQKSVEALKSFLDQKDDKLEQERHFLESIKADCVLTDAAFLGCLAAKAANVPSILITNFTFDSVYSYLSTPLLDVEEPTAHLRPTDRLTFDHLIPDVPVPLKELAPLVDQLYAGYKCADLLVLLPGSIPIPSFFKYPPLPSPNWIDPRTNSFHPEIIERLTKSSPEPCRPHSPSVMEQNTYARSVMSCPLLVRPASTNPSPYTASGRSSLLSSIGIPDHMHNPQKTKILVVSFGGQIFHAPSRSGSRSTSRAGSPRRNGDNSPNRMLTQTTDVINQPSNDSLLPTSSEINSPTSSSVLDTPAPPLHTHINGPNLPNISVPHRGEFLPPIHTSPRLATPSHIYIPGAPPASISPTSSRLVATTFSAQTIPPSPSPTSNDFAHATYFDATAEPDVQLLPDQSWIAVVCGVSKEQWDREQDGLPYNFFVAPKEVYMPDLVSVANVLLGKLGYGTVSECVDSCTPFVYVSRPLFIEEHGLRLLLEQQGVGVELSRSAYEAGEWASAIEKAWVKGGDAKMKKLNREYTDEMGRTEDGWTMAQKVHDWVKGWWERTKELPPKLDS